MQTENTATQRQVVFGLRRLAEVALERGDKQIAERANSLAGRLQENIFNLAVVGQFKRGKSTLINALLGQNLLPTGVVPLTSVITIIEYDEREVITIHFADGTNSEINSEDLNKYVTERGNPANKRGVTAAVARLASPLLSTGIRIIDTPGVGSVYAHNTEIAYKFIPHIDGAIFLITADPPVSQSEIKFLKDLHAEVENIFFVQNKTDQLSASEMSESLEFSRAQLAMAVGDDAVEVFPLSAREALKAKEHKDESRLVRSGLLEFESVLTAFIDSEKTEVAVEAGLKTTRRLIQQMLGAISIEKAALSLPLEELEERRLEFAKYLEQMRIAREDNRHLLKAAQARVIKEVIDADLKSFQARVRPDLIKQLEEKANQAGDLSGRDLLMRLNRFIQEAIEEVYKEWIAQEEDRVANALRVSTERFTMQINTSLKKLVQISNELFHVDMEALSANEELSGEREFFFRPWQINIIPDMLSSSLLYILPGRWVRKALFKTVRDKLIEQLDMHGGRVRYDFVRRLDRSIREFAQHVFNAMDITIEAIEQAIERAVMQKRSTDMASESRMGELERQEVELKAIIVKLGGPSIMT